MPPSPHEHAFSLALITALALVCLALFSTPGEPASVYVTNTGSDAHTCQQARNQATPRRSVNAGIACLAAGDTLILGDGTYSEQLSDVVSGETPNTVRPPSGLSWSQPTTIKSANPRKAVIDKPQPGEPYNHTVYLGRADTSYLSIEGLVIDGRGHGTCLWVGPGSHIRIQGNVIKNCGGNGVYSAVADDGSGGQDIHLLDNEIFNIATEEAGPPGRHAVYFTGNNSVMKGNYIHAPCPFYGIQATSEKGGLHHNVIENNRVVGCDQAGIYSQGSDTVIRNNLAENNCIGIYLASAPTLVSNNTIWGHHFGPNCPDSYGLIDSSSGSTLVNNVILQQMAGWAYIYSAKVPPTMQTNLCDAASGHTCQLTAAPGSVIVDGPAGNLTLQAGGPAVNTGTTVAQVPTDRLGVIRPQGAAYDLGAYEYSTSAPPEAGAGADTTPPTVAVTSPAPGASVSGMTTLQATASDNVGIAGFQYKLDGKNLGPEIVQPPYAYAWDTASSTPGVHTLAASVRDAAGNFATSVSVIVTVTPMAPGVPRPPAASALTCTGTINAVPGPVTMDCQPVTGTR